MALQNGFKIKRLTVLNNGGGYTANSDTISLTARDKGQGSGFVGVGHSNAAGQIISASVVSKGKNYSSGSWASPFQSPAIKGEFVTIAINNQEGSGSIILPEIGMDVSMSISDINVERGISANTANSDIHDLYEDFASVGGTNSIGQTVDVDGEVVTWNKPNFDWYQGGPISGSQSHPIRFDEFYGSLYDTYGGRGCLAIGTPITMADGSVKNIEDINIGDWVRSATVPGMPLDFDDEDTWITWSGTPHGNAPNSVWATAYYDIQETNRVTPVSASVMDIYFDYYDSYYIINDSLNVTYEHPFFVLRNGFYKFSKTVDLQVGDRLFKSNNQFDTLESIQFVDEPIETVNLNVESLDVYFGGGYLMHNVHGK